MASPSVVQHRERYIDNLVLESQQHPETLERINPITGLPHSYQQDLLTIREAVFSCVTVEQLKAILAVQIDKAMNGSDFSCKWVFDRVFGPVQSKQVNVTKTTTNNTVQLVDLTKFTPEQLKTLQEMKRAIEGKPDVPEPKEDE